MIIFEKMHNLIKKNHHSAIMWRAFLRFFWLNLSLQLSNKKRHDQKMVSSWFVWHWWLVFLSSNYAELFLCLKLSGTNRKIIANPAGFVWWRPHGCTPARVVAVCGQTADFGNAFFDHMDIDVANSVQNLAFWLFDAKRTAFFALKDAFAFITVVRCINFASGGFWSGQCCHW